MALFGFHPYFDYLKTVFLIFISWFTEADRLCGRLYQKLNSVLGQKIVMDHMPLLMVCLEVSRLFVTVSKKKEIKSGFFSN